MSRRSLAPLGVAVGLLAVLAGSASPARAFVCLQINGHCTRWAQGGTTLRSFLGNPGRALINGTLSWDQNSVQAANDWNAAGAAFHFDVAVGGNFVNPCGPAGAGHACTNTGPVGDNPVFFTDNFCGQGFGDIIELTNNCANINTGAMLNAPVFVNSHPSNASNDPRSIMGWNAYNGPILIGVDNRPINDVRRVLVHEFGHVLGLDHPDQNMQSVVAIMNSRESDIFQLQQDDINGLFSLYPNGGAPNANSGSANQGCQIAERGVPTHGWVVLTPPLLLLLRLRRRIGS